MLSLVDALLSHCSIDPAHTYYVHAHVRHGAGLDLQRFVAKQPVGLLQLMLGIR